MASALYGSFKADAGFVQKGGMRRAPSRWLQSALRRWRRVRPFVASGDGAPPFMGGPPLLTAGLASLTNTTAPKLDGLRAGKAADVKRFTPAAAPVPAHFLPIPGYRSNTPEAQRARRMIKRLKLREQGGRCCYCQQPLSVAKATVEHRKPFARGGIDAPSNIDVACLRCNGAKGWLTKPEFERAIFNPNVRRDPWPLYLACVEIRLKRFTERACKRLARMVA